MIEPKMATMLAFVMTDAAIKPPALKRTLARALPHSFNAITVDGDMSTNDTLLLMASGAAGNRALAGRDLAKFESAVADVSERACARTGARRRRRDQAGDGRGARRAHRMPKPIASRAKSPTRRWSRPRSSAAIRISGGS